MQLAYKALRLASIAFLFLCTEAVLSILVRKLSLASEYASVVLIDSSINSGNHFWQPLCDWRSCMIMFALSLSQPHPKKKKRLMLGKKNSRARKKQYKPLANARINVGESQPGQGYREQAKDIKWRWPWPLSTFLFGSNTLSYPHRIHASSTSLFTFLFVFHAFIPPLDICLARLFVIRHSLFVPLIVVRSKPVRFDHVPLLCSTMLFVFCQGFSFVSCHHSFLTIKPKYFLL